jgi:hypothetical protein
VRNHSKDSVTGFSESELVVRSLAYRLSQNSGRESSSISASLAMIPGIIGDTAWLT